MFVMLHHTEMLQSGAGTEMLRSGAGTEMLQSGAGAPGPVAHRTLL